MAREITASELYWQERAKNRVTRAELLGVKTMENVMPLYDAALKNITKEVNTLYLNYSNKVGLDVGELGKILSGVDKNNFLKSIQSTMKTLGFKVSDVYQPSYIARLSRLEAMKQQIYWEIQKLAPGIIEAQTRGYAKIIKDSYMVAKKDIREQVGSAGTFGSIEGRVVDEILLNRWQDRTYIDSTGNNITVLGSKLREVVGGGLVSGISQNKMEMQIREGINLGKYEAARLIRTETNYFQNQAELQSYIDDGWEFYRYEAVMDNITSKVCRNMHGSIWRVDEAIVGYNYPPLHPNCRSTTVVATKGEAQRDKVERVNPGVTEGSLAPEDKTVLNWARRNQDAQIERAIIVDRKTGEVLEKASGTETDVNFTLRQWGEAYNNIIVHNHPFTGGRTSFAPTDITAGINKGAWATQVVGREGIYSMEFGDITSLSKQRQFEITREIKDMFVDYLSKLKKLDNATFNQKLWEDVAKRYGFKYGFKPVD